MDCLRGVYRRALIGLTVLYAIVLTCSVASAFTVSPSRVEISLPAGESFTGSFTVGNPSDATVKVRVTVEDWSSAQQDREITKGEVSSLGWLTFSAQELKLEPNRSEIVNYTVILPKEAEGEYAAMVYFGTVAEPSKKGVSVIRRIGNALYVVVEGTEIVKGEISKIIISRVEPLKIDVTVKNEGNIHIRPRGKIIIKKRGLFLSKEDREPIEIPFNKAGFPLLPQQDYIFETRAKERLVPGRYRLKLTMEFGHEGVQREFSFTITDKGEVIRFGVEN